MTVIAKQAYEEFERDFQKRRDTSVECGHCGKSRLYGRGCTNCKKVIMSLLEFAEALRISAEEERRRSIN